MLDIYKPKWYSIHILHGSCLVTIEFENAYDTMYGDSVSFYDVTEFYIKKSMIKDLKKLMKKYLISA